MVSITARRDRVRHQHQHRGIGRFENGSISRGKQVKHLYRAAAAPATAVRRARAMIGKKTHDAAGIKRIVGAQ